VAAAGCGGDDQSGAEQWADSVCTDLNTWADSMTTTISGVMSEGLGGHEQRPSRRREPGLERDDPPRRRLREIGPPDTESGQAAQQQLQQVGDSIEQHATKARELVESGSSSSAGLVATARSVLVEIGARPTRSRARCRRSSRRARTSGAGSRRATPARSSATATSRAARTS
jgi:hypothetical protein